ncbi:MAG: 3-hydroxyacyl-CoA dehydrogenase family protein [Ferruginibacter sp.]
MKIAVLSDDDGWNELIACNNYINWIRINNVEELLYTEDVHAGFILHPADKALHNYPGTYPLFINSVTTTLQEMNAGDNLIRINGWAGFLAKRIWEVCGNLNEAATAVLRELGKQYIQVPDEPGFISARIIAMIINEAYYAAGENVSSETDIDIAMKLGTNYPYGPFEWSKIIGEKNIYNLLMKLSIRDSRYTIAPALEKFIHS